MEILKFFKRLILYAFLFNFISIVTVTGYCNLNGNLYDNGVVWQNDCKNCTCIDSIPFCEKIECKYEQCNKGQVLMLSNDVCCPSCQYPKKSCTYEGVLIEHNTEFSPKICDTCKCRDGLIECINTCLSEKYNLKKDLCISGVNSEMAAECKNDESNKSNHQSSVCVYDGREYKNNTIWSPISCTICKCENENVKCYVMECPIIECPFGYEIHQGDCCPTCKPKTCIDENHTYYEGDSWTRHSDQCTHCACLNGKTSCFTQNCTSIKCASDEVLVSKSNHCCPKCVSKTDEHCEYYGKTYHNGEIWYMNGCQHCACDYGRVLCTTVECESKFCLKNEIMVKRRDECCVECRKPIYCQIDNKIKIKENDFWSPDSCKICQCVLGESKCYIGDCSDPSSFATHSQMAIKYSKETELNLDNLNFLKNLQKLLNKESIIQIISGPKYGTVYVDNRRKSNFTLSELELSKVTYKQYREDAPVLDYIVFVVVSPYTGITYTSLVKLNMELIQNDEGNIQVMNDGDYQNDDFTQNKLQKTIYVVPGEAVKLTASELRPKHINIDGERLLYSLVSGKPKFGEIKLKKLLGPDDNTQLKDWSQVNDIYVEKTIKTFTQSDLDNGNVWYEPFNDYDKKDDCPKDISDYQIELVCADPYSPECIAAQDKYNSQCYESFGGSNSLSTPNVKYDHLLFEVYDKERPDEAISKEVIHFNIQNQVINETVLGLEVIENQVTPFTFSNFDIAGIDSNREYLVYRIIKPLDKNQGQLEHSTKPGIPIQTFTQNDLNKGYVLYNAPKEIGVHPKEFTFTFIVTNDNRSDTFPETPFHVRVLPSNDQAPKFKESSSTLKLMQSSTITLPRQLFEVDDPDTAIDNLIFSIDKTPDNCILELRSKGHHHSLNKGESFTMQEVRNATFRLIHNAARVEKDNFKISVSDGKHISTKTFQINIQFIDKIAPHLAKHATLLLNVKENQNKVLRRDNLAFVDEQSSAEEIVYKLLPTNFDNLRGKLFLRNKQLKPSMSFTQADIDLQNLRYEAPVETGPITVNDQIHFSVNDKEGNTVNDQILTVTIEPVDNQSPIVEITHPAKVQEGGYLVLSENYIRVRDADSAKEQLNVIIDSAPSFGYFENTITGTKLTSFPLVSLINGQLIRYIQSDHKNKEPTADSFIFHVSDGVNKSPTFKFTITIEPVNDEPPIAIFQPLFAEYNKMITITNETLLVLDLDSKPDSIFLQAEEPPKYGILLLNDIIVDKNIKIPYSSVLNKRLSYKNTENFNLRDEIKFKINDGKFTSVAILQIKLKAVSKDAPTLIKNGGLSAISGHLFPIMRNNLYSINKNNPVFYKILRLPEFGKLQYRSESVYSDFGSHSNLIYFTQKDIDEGKIYYNHASDESTGITYMTFNLTDKYGNSLSDQRFTIIVRDDKIPPVVIQNKGIKVNQGQSTILTKNEFDIKDDDTSLKNIEFKIVAPSKYGRIENIKEPGKIISQFTYEDLLNNHVKYIHNNSIGSDLRDDQIDLRVSDGKNDVSVTVTITIIRNDNVMPILESSYLLRVKESNRKAFSKAELNIIDSDTPPEELKFIITHPPQYGIIERIDKHLEAIQTHKSKHKFELNKNQTISLILSPTPTYAVSVSEFTLKDVEAGLINYYHKIPGVTLDRFGFIIFDGVNNMFIVNGVRTTAVQLFTVHIDSDINQPPTLDKNLGVEYLYLINNIPGRMITKNEWNIIDRDDDDKSLVISVQRQPAFGVLEHKERPGIPIIQLTQDDISQNKISYMLKKQDNSITEDYFTYDVADSAKNSLKNNRFDIKWSIVNFEVNEITVMEDEGKARVHITKTGNLKQYSMITCKTISDTAKSNRDTKSYDFIHTVIKVEFNEGESYKACDIVLHKDSNIEPIESFFVELEDPKYSIIGTRNRVKVNILDKQKVAIVEFDKTKFEVQESDKLVSLPILRTGDLSVDVEIECYTKDETAKANSDYQPRVLNSFNYNLIKIPAGEIYGFCDIELIDDDLHEINSETFKAILANPSTQGVQIGSKSEAKITIIGPNDVQQNNCKSIHFKVKENSEQVVVDIQRENSDINEEIEVLCTTHVIVDNFTSPYLRAVPNEDFIPVNNIIKFLSGELSKKCYIPILNDANESIMEGQKLLIIQITPISKGQTTDNSLLCNLVDPDFVHVLIDDMKEDSISISFNQTNFVAQETQRNLSLPLIRTGDLSQAVSVICYTRQLTAIEDIDYKGRYTLEHSRVYFEPGERIKYCTVEIIDDTIYEADETFQVRLSDIRGTNNARFDQYAAATITITNEEDATIISLSDENYFTEEPSSNDSSVIKPITIIRTGDLSRNSIVRISTSDNTAIGGQDYKPKTETIVFEPGVSALDFDINILFDTEKENVESFKVVLGPQDPIAAVFGKIKTANVFIKDNGISSIRFKDGSVIDDPTVDEILSQNYFDDINMSKMEKLSVGQPLVTTLYNMMETKTPTSDNKLNVPAGAPLVCIHTCEKDHPNYLKSTKLCNILNSMKISYFWEVSTPNKFGSYSNYVKLTDDTIFSTVNQSVLEAFYFRPKFRIRCTTQFIKSTGSNWILKSDYVEVNNIYDEPSNETCANIEIPTFSDLTSTLPELNLNENVLNDQWNLIFEDSISVKAEYMSDYMDSIDENDVLEYVKINVNIPYIDGMIPLVSTTPLHNCRYLMTEPQYSENHKCSNFILKNGSVNSAIKYGFVKDSNARENSFLRDNRTLDFYSNLNDCQWKFTAYYDIDELINHCQAQLIPESEIQESTRGFMTLKIPLYISYVYASAPIGWQCIEFRSDIETSINYRIAYDESNDSLIKSALIKNVNYESFKESFALTVTKVSLLNDGRLFIEFVTLPSFNGNFVKSHPSLSNYKSRFYGPENQNIDYTMDLFWNQYSQENPKQIWRIRSTEPLNNFAGNYTVELIPCIFQNQDEFEHPMDCEPKVPIRYTIPLIIEQTIRPVPLKYSLDTTFHLTNKALNISNYRNDEFDGYFRMDDTIYGTVIWNSKQEMKSAYKLELDKVLLCSTINGYMPIYDPDGSVYKRGSKYGCLETHKSIINQLLVLDRTNPKSITTKFRQLSFNAEFFNNEAYSNLINSTISTDSFKFNINPLFESNSTIENNWYIQVFFYIRPASSKFNRRDNEKQRFSTLYHFSNNIFNNGTNIQTLKLGDKRHKVSLNNKRKLSSSYPATETGGVIHLKRQHSNSDLLLKILIPILILISLITITFIAIMYFRRRNFLLKNELLDTKVPPFPKVSESDNNANSVTIITLPNSLKCDYMQRTGTIRTKIIRTETSTNDDSNCTLQTVISSAASSTNSHDSCYALTSKQLQQTQSSSDDNQTNNTQSIFNNKKLRTFIKKIYASVPTEENHTDTEIATKKRFSTSSLKKSKKNRSNNYLYFNYTNSSELNNSISESTKRQSSVKSLLLNTIAPSKNKRLSGTEV